MDQLLYIGAYAEIGEPGITCVRLGKDGGLHMAADYRGMENPSWLTRRPAGKCLYAISELAEGGEIRALKIQPDGTLAEMGSMPVSGGAACHIGVSQNGEVLAVSNYMSGIVDLYRAGADGALRERLPSLVHEGSGPNKARQVGPHAHFAVFHPMIENRMLCVDLGSDKVRVYDIDTNAGKAEKAGEIVFPRGSGPRHLAFHPHCPDLIYAICELGMCVYTLRLAGTEGTIIDQKPCALPDFRGKGAAAAVRTDTEGRFLYTSLRAYNGRPDEDCVACFRLDSATGIPEAPSFFTGIAPEPRDIALAEGYLLVACQSGGKLLSLELDGESGLPIRSVGSLDIPGASCIC